MLNVESAAKPFNIQHSLFNFKFNILCGSCWDRTNDPLIMSQVL
jgi:hypothetical protein